MKICISADHGGFDLKKIIIDHVKSLGFEIFHIGRITSKKNSINFLDGNKKIDFDLSKEYEHF